MKQIKVVIGIFLSKLFGLLIFLVILGLLNFLMPYINEPIFSLIVSFLNANLLLILMFSLFFTISELFFALVFPFDLPAPLFSSFGSFFLVTFIFNILNFVSDSFKMGLNGLLNSTYILITSIVFFIVFLSGYGIVFGRGIKPRKKRKSKRIKKVIFFDDVLKKISNEDEDRKDEDRKDEDRENYLEEIDNKNIKKRKFKKIPSKKASLVEVGDAIKKRKY